MTTKRSPWELTFFNVTGRELGTRQVHMDIFNHNEVRARQLATWMREDVPVEVITKEYGRYVRYEYRDLAEAREAFPHLKKENGHRGKFLNQDGTTRVEYALRFEEYARTEREEEMQRLRGEV